MVEQQIDGAVLALPLLLDQKLHLGERLGKVPDDVVGAVGASAGHHQHVGHLGNPPLLSEDRTYRPLDVLLLVVRAYPEGHGDALLDVGKRFILVLWHIVLPLRNGEGPALAVVVESEEQAYRHVVGGGRPSVPYGLGHSAAVPAEHLPALPALGELLEAAEGHVPAGAYAHQRLALVEIGRVIDLVVIEIRIGILLRETALVRIDVVVAEGRVVLVVNVQGLVVVAYDVRCGYCPVGVDDVLAVSL